MEFTYSSVLLGFCMRAWVQENENTKQLRLSMHRKSIRVVLHYLAFEIYTNKYNWIDAMGIDKSIRYAHVRIICISVPIFGALINDMCRVCVRVTALRKEDVCMLCVLFVFILLSSLTWNAPVPGIRVNVTSYNMCEESFVLRMLSQLFLWHR